MPLGLLTPSTTAEFDPASRVRVELGHTGFQKGKEFRWILEFFKTAAEVIYVKFSCPIPVLLYAAKLSLDSGSARYSTRGAPVFSGTFTVKPSVNTNSMMFPAAIPVAQTVVSWALAPTGTVTDSGDRDIVRVRSGSSQGANSPVSVSDGTIHRGLAAGDHCIKIEGITGVTDNTAVNGILELIWSEYPEEYL